MLPLLFLFAVLAPCVAVALEKCGKTRDMGHIMGPGPRDYRYGEYIYEIDAAEKQIVPRWTGEHKSPFDKLESYLAEISKAVAGVKKHESTIRVEWPKMETSLHEVERLGKLVMNPPQPHKLLACQDDWRVLLYYLDDAGKRLKVVPAIPLCTSVQILPGYVVADPAGVRYEKGRLHFRLSESTSRNARVQRNRAPIDVSAPLIDIGGAHIIAGADIISEGPGGEKLGAALINILPGVFWVNTIRVSAADDTALDAISSLFGDQLKEGKNSK